MLVYPGMEIIQGTNVCTLGYVDPQARIAFTAGHCRGDGMVRDRAGNVVGNQALFRDNTPDGTTIDTNHQIADWEAISLAPDVQVNNVLPGGRQLVSDPGFVPSPGLAVCHFGVVTSESCGTIQAVYNGWFTMANGVVSQKGDSGGPVYVVTPDGTRRDRRDVQQHLGAVPGRGELAGRQQAGQRGRHLRRVGNPRGAGGALIEA